MNSYVGAGNKPETSHGLPAPEEALLPGTLNPYHDGRIRTAVPSKLKGRTTRTQGNFSVLQMHIQKPEMTARDLAAKRTSERTAAAAKLASSQGYRHPRRLRLQPSVTYPASVPVAISLTRTFSPPHSQLPSVVPPVPRPNSLPHITTSPAYQERSLHRQAVAAANITLDTDTQQVDDPFTESNGLQEISPEHSRGSLALDTIQEGNTEQPDGPETGQDLTQDTNMEVPGEPFMTVDSPGIETEHTSEVTNVMREVNKEQAREITIDLQETNTSHIAKPGSAPQPLSPAVVKAEQARILTLFRYTQPRFIVDQLVEALVHFGTMPDVPPTETSLFIQSASNNGQGDLFVSWLSEIFPAIPLESHKMKKPPTGRPRGRPKGSTAGYNKETTTVQNVSAVFVPRSLEPHETTSTQITLIRDGPHKSQQAVAGTQGQDVPLSPIQTAQSLTATIVPALRGQEDVTLQPVADVSGQTVAIPRMRPIFPSTAPTAEVSASNPTPVQRKKPTGRPRGRPPGSKNKLKSISKAQSKKVDQQDSRPDKLNCSVSQSGASWPQQQSGGPSDTTESTRVNPNQAVTRVAQADAPNSLGGIKEKRKNTNTEVSNIQNLSFIALKEQRASQQAHPREAPATILPQASDSTAPTINSSLHAQHAKRRRLSQEMVQRDSVSSTSSISGSRALPDVFESNLSLGFQSAQSRPSQYVSRHRNQNWDMENFYPVQQPQSQLHPRLQQPSRPQQLSRNTGSGA
ncbi:hypothetical protein FPSE_03364 [Fusarium pseudograminearum CS3096]|uniref:Uncharacterized protein n=1 Tax=Fusarium pseudograminearum (strain CS3096) TaxID=1028729 RepID=K3VNK3_FUSPC|nr:hypothetical protein FPSE_03364 [Fusarium pseudograminearum CS3096]EKJ76454.1 hypothetical protein FPSE_03364 [Fusarium pseudograminearum CS3096]KAF0636410.1 hypothetical protein FPSE5266_03364 [Fusarium pseudograminearum]